jgi:hypothetical protein
MSELQTIRALIPFGVLIMVLVHASTLTAYELVVPYLTLAKSTRLPILLCKFFNLAGPPKRTVGYLILLFVWQNHKSWYKCRFRFFQNRMVNPCRIFFEPGFRHNFAKNDRLA